MIRNVESFTPLTRFMFMSKRTILKFVEIVFCSQVKLHKLSLRGFSRLWSFILYSLLLIYVGYWILFKVIWRWCNSYNSVIDKKVLNKFFIFYLSYINIPFQYWNYPSKGNFKPCYAKNNNIPLLTYTYECCKRRLLEFNGPKFFVI